LKKGPDKKNIIEMKKNIFKVEIKTHNAIENELLKTTQNHAISR